MSLFFPDSAISRLFVSGGQQKNKVRRIGMSVEIREEIQKISSILPPFFFPTQVSRLMLLYSISSILIPFSFTSFEASLSLLYLFNQP